MRLIKLLTKDKRREIQKLSLEMRLADNGANRVSEVAELEQSYVGNLLRGISSVHCKHLKNRTLQFMTGRRHLSR